MRSPGFIATSVLRNPYIAVIVLARLRRRATLLLSVAWVAIIVLCIELNYFLYSSPNYPLYPSLEHCFFSVFFQLLGIQFFLAFFFTTYYCSNSVSLERSTRTLPLLRATPLSGHAIALGKIASEPARIWILLALGFPFTITCAAVGRVSVNTFVGGYALMLAAGFFSCSLGLLCSALGKKLTKPGQAGAAAIGLTMLMLFVSQALYSTAPLNSFAGLSPIPFFVSSITQRFPIPGPVSVNPNLNFMGAEVHPFFISFPLYVLLGLGCFLGAARRIAEDDVPVLSRAQTVFGYVLYQLAVVGAVINFFHPVRGLTGRAIATPATGDEPMVAYSLLTLAGIVLAALLLTPTRSRVECVIRRGSTKTGLLQRRVCSSTAPPFPLLALLLVIALCGYGFFWRMVMANAFSPVGSSSLLVGAAMLFFCVATFSLFAQSCYLARGKQPVAVAVAALGLYFVFPAILSSILQLSARRIPHTDYIYALNPIYALTRSFSAASSTDTHFLVLGTVVYVVAIGVLVFAVVSQLRGLRRHIDKMRAMP